MNSELRRTRNSQRSNIPYKKGTPSRKSMLEGEEVIAQPPNKPLTIYRKQNGLVWELPFSNNGDYTILRNLTVEGSITVKGKAATTRSYLNFGTSSSITYTEVALKTVNGISNGGYVMIRDGKITGVSIQCDSTDVSSSDPPESVVIYIHKNESSYLSTTLLNILQEADTSTNRYGQNTWDSSNSFSAGDRLNVRIKTSDSNFRIQNIVCALEIET